MKYWRGYLVALILALCSWGLIEFAQSHWVLVDMVYPYTSRIIQDFMAVWSSGAAYCVWQLLLLVLVAGVLASIVMMIIWKWNPIQWFGWVMAVVSLVMLLNTGLYGLNEYAGPIADDIRLNVTDYSVDELQDAAEFYQKEANQLSQQVKRDSSGQVQYPDFETLAQQAADGFDTLTYEKYNSIFAGDRTPVKELGWSKYFSGKGKTYVHIPITGEAAVNPETPAVGLPFAMCQVMANRVCIANEQDAAFAAFLACINNDAVEFRYAGYFMAYRYCYDALASKNVSSAQSALQTLTAGECSQLKQDLQAYNSSFAPGSDNAYYEKEVQKIDFTKLLNRLKRNPLNKDAADTASEEVEITDAPERSDVADLLVSWHIQEYVLPLLKEEEVKFDPLDETQVDLSGLIKE